MDDIVIPENGNAWQILAQEYSGNSSLHKTVSDENVRIQKNIIPTENENEFKVYVSLDARATSATTSEQLTKFMEDAMEDNLYVGGSSPHASATYLTGEDTTAIEGYCVSQISPGTEKPLANDGDQAIQLHISHDGVLLAEPTLHFAVPNSIMLYKLPGTEGRMYDYIMLQAFATSGGKVYTTSDPKPWNNSHGNEITPRIAGGTKIYDVYIDLTDMAYSRLLTTVPGEEYSETSSVVLGGDDSASGGIVTDPMGDYMAESVTIDAVDGTASVSAGTITWNLGAKPEGSYGIEEGSTYSAMIPPYTDPDGALHSGSVTYKDWWNLNVAELVYTVKLDVLKDGFESFRSYPANGAAELNYSLELYDGEILTGRLPLPVPQVQGRIFYVYHSSDCGVDKYPYTNAAVKLQSDDYMNGGASTSAEIDLVSLVKDGYLYGGYYKTYAGANAKDVVGARALHYTVSGAGAADQKAEAADPGIPYDASKANVWKAANAYTDARGDEMSPKPDYVYYLKEVPDGYIRPYIHFTYDDYDPEKPLKSLYIITATDDTNYNGAGYIVLPADPETQTGGNKALIFSIKKSDGTTAATLTAKSVFSPKYSSVKRGYLYWVNASDLIGGASFKYQPCWTTLDGILVKGITARTINDITTQLSISVTDE